MWACGAMDNAPDYGSGDSRFDSWQARSITDHSFLATDYWASSSANL